MTALPAAAHPTRDDDTRQGGERCANCGHPKSQHDWEFDQCCSGPGQNKYGCGCPEFHTTPARLDAGTDTTDTERGR